MGLVGVSVAAALAWLVALGNTVEALAPDDAQTEPLPGDPALSHAGALGAPTVGKKYWLRCSRADNFTGCLGDRSVLEDNDFVSRKQALTIKTRDILARLHRHEFFLMPWPRSAEWEHQQYQKMLREPATKRGDARRSYSERWYGSSLSGNNPLRIEEIRAIIAEGGETGPPTAGTPMAITVLRGEKKLHANQKPGAPPVPSVPWKEKKKIWTLRLARELLMAGESDEALELFESLCSGTKSNRLFANKCTDRRATSMADQMLRDFLALAWIRLAEQENCVADHTHESCLAPIRGAGVHRRQRGATGAIGVLNSTLQIVPHDLSSQYLMNIAHQQLGSPAPDTLGIDASLIYSEQLYSKDAKRYANFPRFLNVASPLKLDTVSLAGGVVVDDLNNDGLLDIVSSGDGLNDQLRVYINSGHGVFDEYTERTDLQGESMIGIVGGINLCHTDYNNDGNIDVMVIRGGWKFGSMVAPNTLLKGHGDGSFTDVTAQAGLLFPAANSENAEINLNILRHHSSHSATWGDYDLDGWVDLFVAAERDHWVGNQKCQLFHNNKDGTFTDVADPVMRECGWRGNPKSKGGSLSKGSTWGDVNGDGWPDLYISHLDAPNSLFLNKGRPQDSVTPAGGASVWDFEEVSKASGTDIRQGTFATWMFDYNNDGHLDLFAAGYGGDDDSMEEVARTFLGKGDERPKNHERLLRNNGDGTFTDATIEVGLGYTSGTMGANFGDLDNDGFLDAYMGTGNPDMRTLQPNAMVRNVGGSHFEDVTYSGGFGHLQKGHGIAFGDLDNDGDQEIVANMGAFFSGDFFKSAVFFNPIRNHSEPVDSNTGLPSVLSHHYIKIKLIGKQSNRAAIGARVAVTVRSPSAAGGGSSWFGFGGGSSCIRTIYAVVSEGGSYGSNPFQLHVGLGDAVAIEKIEITWPVREQTVQSFVPNGPSRPFSHPLRDCTLAHCANTDWTEQESWTPPWNSSWTAPSQLQRGSRGHDC